MSLKDFEYCTGSNFTIYLGKWEEVLPLLALSDIGIDITVCDPPYGMNYHSNHYKHGNPHQRIKGDNKPYPVDLLTSCMSISSCATLFFCHWSNFFDGTVFPRPKSLINWIKNNWSAGDLKHGYGAMAEYVLFYPGPDHSFADKRPHNVINSPRAIPVHHPVEKPVALIEELIKCNVGEIVLDPCMGAGSTLLAANNLGRYAIGIDDTEEHARTAMMRLQNYI